MEKHHLNFLITQLDSGRDAAGVLDALKPACVYEETRNRVREVIERTGDPQLKAKFQRG